ncbi:putative integral membrane protein [Tropheryma whipplei TW08/27]|nr:putative integral membrane protein [Tropheryma whipplei TW08/27]
MTHLSVLLRVCCVTCVRVTVTPSLVRVIVSCLLLPVTCLVNPACSSSLIIWLAFGSVVVATALSVVTDVVAYVGVAMNIREKITERVIIRNFMFVLGILSPLTCYGLIITWGLDGCISLWCIR